MRPSRSSTGWWSGLEDNLALLFAGVLLLSIGSAMSSGGGRELLSRPEASIHPLSPLTDHLGALALAPLNLAWLVQVWACRPPPPS